MKRHPAMPQVQRFDRVLQIIAGLIKQHITDAAAEHDAEGRPNQKIIDIAALDEARRPVRQDQAIAPADQQPGNIGEGIPADDKRADRDGHRINGWERDREERHLRCFAAHRRAGLAHSHCDGRPL